MDILVPQQRVATTPDDDAGHGADPFPKTDSDMDICSAMLKSVMARAHKILLIIKNGG